MSTSREVLSSCTQYSHPGKLSYCDIPNIYIGSYIVRVTCMNSTRDTIIDRVWGSFSNGTDIAVVSCNNSLGSSAMWEFMTKKVPSTCLHIGDNIYMDNGSTTFISAHESMNMIGEDISNYDWDNIVDIFRQGYRNHWSSPHMKAILSSCCNIFIWDDHDVCDSWDQDIKLPTGWDLYSGDDMWLNIAKDTISPRKRTIIAAMQAYCEYQLPMSLGGNHPHIPGSFSYQIGDKDIVFIDRRMHIIGDTPLVPQLYLDNDRKPDIIISTVPIFFLHPCISNSFIDWMMRNITGIKDLHDHWILYPDDLQSILSITKNNTIIISGDVHMCGKTTINIKNDYNEYNILQITSSAISSSPSPSALLLFLKLLRKFKVNVGSYICSIKHQSWTRDNGYITFDISHTYPEINYILSSLIEV